MVETVWNADCHSIQREFFHGMKKTPKTLEAFSSFTLLFLSPPSSHSGEGEREETVEECRRQLRLAEGSGDGIHSKVIRTLQDASLCGGVEKVCARVVQSRPCAHHLSSLSLSLLLSLLQLDLSEMNLKYFPNERTVPSSLHLSVISLDASYAPLSMFIIF